MKVKAAVVGLAALGCVALTAGPAAAMPNGLPQAKQITSQTTNIDQVRWVCAGPGRCWWRRGPRFGWGPRVAWGPRPLWRPGWRSSFAFAPGPVWGPRPFWGPRPGWGW